MTKKKAITVYPLKEKGRKWTTYSLSPQALVAAVLSARGEAS